MLNHRTPLDLGVPPVGPVAARAHREGALIELDNNVNDEEFATALVDKLDSYLGAAR